MESCKSFNSPADFKYYLHASISCLNVCNKVIQQSPEGMAGLQYPSTSVRKPLDAALPELPLNFHKPLWALSHFSWANHRKGKGQRATLDVPQLPMGNASPSHTQGITNSLLSALTSEGGCSKLTARAVHRELCWTWGGTAPWYLGNLSHLVFEDILTRASHIFHYICQGMQSVPTSERVVNRRGLTLFTVWTLNTSSLFTWQYVSRKMNKWRYLTHVF